MKRTVLVIAAAAAVLSYKTLLSAAGYFGEAPWCAVMNIGAGTVTWDCQFATVEACTPNILAGNRGFCALNPYFSPVPPYGAAHTRRVRRVPQMY
jgi:hypothetical protein